MVKVVKGSGWIILGAVTLITLLLLSSLLIRHNKDWCILAKNVGDCDYYEEDEDCYCIDTFKYKNITGQSNYLTIIYCIYDSSRAQCEAMGGHLAAPDQTDLTIWLAKRMFFMGVENAVVALRKILSKWYWIKPGTKNQEAVDITWREEFPPDSKHKQGILTVETVEKDVGTDVYIYYNYDHYLDTDKAYGWYGFSTINKNFTHDAYYICKYDSGSDLTTANKESHVLDPCDCTGTDINLRNLDDSQTFQSPQYPKNYCSDTNCKWFVSVEGDLGIQLDWLVFSLELNMDYVLIRDGHEHDSPIIKECTGWKCGNQRSTTNKIQIHFLADHVTTDLGFRARVTAVQTDVCYCSESLTVDLTNLLESFTIHSPNYPGKYCTLQNCQWTFGAPESLGLHITFKDFDLQHNDNLFIYDGLEELLDSCTGSNCADKITSGNEMHVKFVTDNSESVNTGFQAIVTVVQNYCLKWQTRSENRDVEEEELFIKEEFFTHIRDDGFIPVRANATVVCEENSKIQGTGDGTIDSVTCESPLWDREIGVCIQTCNVEFSTFSKNYEDVTICSSDDTPSHIYVNHPKPSHVIGSGASLTVVHYDFIHQQPVLEVVYTCNGNQWTDRWGPELQHNQMREFRRRQNPRILIVGGGSIDGDDRLAMQLFYPTEPHLSHVADTEMIDYRTSHTSAMIPDGSVVTCGTWWGLRSDTVSCERYFPRENKVLATEPLNSFRQNAAMAVLNGFLFICGGSDYIEDLLRYSSCERYTPGVGWEYITSMNNERSNLVLVAYHGQLVAIGGSVYADTEEAYSPLTDHWSEFPSLILSRSYGAAAAVMNGKLFVCGGDIWDDDLYGGMSLPSNTCEQYSPAETQWVFIDQMQEERSSFQMVTIDDKLFAIRGGGAFKMEPIEVFDGYEWTVIELEETSTLHDLGEFTAVLVP